MVPLRDRGTVDAPRCYMSIVSLPIHLLSWYGIWDNRLYSIYGRPLLPTPCCLLFPFPGHPIVFFRFGPKRGGVHVWLSFWGYANCYADIIINLLGKQAGNKLGFEWVIVFLRCAAFLNACIVLLLLLWVTECLFSLLAVAMAIAVAVAMTVAMQILLLAKHTIFCCC